MGLVNLPTDKDGLNRRYWPISHWPIIKAPRDTIFYNSLAIQTVIEYLGITSIKPIIDKYNKVVRFESLNHSAFLEIPSYGEYDAGFRINFSFKIPQLPLYKILDTKDYELIEMDTDWMEDYIILDNNVDNIFDGKIVVIGTSLFQDQDFVSSPYESFNNEGDIMTGVEYHGYAIQTILDNNYNNIVPYDSTQYNSDFRKIVLDGDWSNP